MKSTNRWMAAVTLGTLLAAGTNAMAQERDWHEASIQATGAFTKDSAANDVQQHTTDSGGLLLGYRFHFSRWLAAEASYGYNRNTHQNLTAGGPFDVRANTHQTSGALVVTLPAAPRAEPFLLAGVGALVFDPRDSDVGTIGAAEQQTKAAFVYGGGANINLVPHVSLRMEYRGLVYKRPDFGVGLANSRATAHTVQPSAGLSFRF